jgi:hypothetical protein
MADDDERAAEALEPLLDPLDRADVEMVGRLVEQQHVGVLRHRADDRRAAPLATRRRRRLAREVDAELIRDRIRFVIHRRVVARHHVIAQRREAAQVGLLLEDHDAGAGDDHSAAFVGDDAAAEQFEQGRLSGAVAADQREPVARADVDVEVAKEPSRALDESEAFEC